MSRTRKRRKKPGRDSDTRDNSKSLRESQATEKAPTFCDRRGTLLVWIMMGVYSAVFITICVIKYRYFLYDDFDMAAHTQGAHQLLRGNLRSSILEVHYLGNHMSLLTFVIAPVYAVASSPITLLVLQTVVLALGALPVYWFARRVLADNFVAVCFAALYLLYPALGYCNLYEFHPETLTTTTLLFAFYYMWVGRFRPMLVFVLLSLLGKENVPIVIIMMGLYSLLLKRPRRWVYAATLVGLAAVFLVVSFGFLLPALNKGEVQFQSIYAHWGDSTGEAILNMAKSPDRVLEELFVTPGNERDTGVKQQYYLHVLLPVLLLSLLSPQTLAIAGPSLAQHLLSSRVTEHTIVYHYMAQMTPFIILSAVLGLRNLSRFVAFLRRRSRGGKSADAGAPSPMPARVVVLAAIAASIVSNVLFGPVIGRDITMTVLPPEHKLPTGLERAMAPYMRDMIDRIGADAPVASGFRCLAALANRKSVHSLHHVYSGKHTLSDKTYSPPANVSAVIVDTDNFRYTIFKRPGGHRRLQSFFELNNLKIVDAAGDAVLLLRDPKDPLNLFEIGDFEPEKPFRAEYKRQLAFLGWDALPEVARVGGKIPIVTHWRRTGKVGNIYRTGFSLIDENGEVAARHNRRICYTFFPAHAWPKGEDLKETYNLIVPTDVKPGKYKVGLVVIIEVGNDLRQPYCSNPVVRKANGVIDLGTVTIAPAGD